MSKYSIIFVKVSYKVIKLKEALVCFEYIRNYIYEYIASHRAFIDIIVVILSILFDYYKYIFKFINNYFQ